MCKTLVLSALLFAIACSSPKFDRRDAATDGELFRHFPFIRKMWIEEYKSGAVYDAFELGGSFRKDGTFCPGKTHPLRIENGNADLPGEVLVYPDTVVRFHFHPALVRTAQRIMRLGAGPSDVDIASVIKTGKMNRSNHYVFHWSGVWRIAPDGAVTKIMGGEWWK